MKHLRIEIDGEVRFDEDVPDDGLRYNVTRCTPLKHGDPGGPSTVELQASTDALRHLVDWWKL